MARIRSVHPGLFTDEAFMEASPMARLLAIGLWTEAWDDGVFEWKPLVIKARIFPADSCDAAAMLDELARLNIVRMIERGGKRYGLIRNFCKYQRPKKPNASGVVSELDAEYLGLSIPKSTTGTGVTTEHSHTGSEPVPNHSGTGGEISPQMEDGGWRMKEEDGGTSSQLRPEAASERASGHEPGSNAVPPSGLSSEDLCQKLKVAAGWQNDPNPQLLNVAPIWRLLVDGFDLDREILPLIRARSTKMRHPVKSWEYFVEAIREARDRPGAERGSADCADQLEEAKRVLAAKRRSEEKAR